MPTYSFTEAELVRFAGTDAAMYLRVQHFGKSPATMPLCASHVASAVCKLGC